MGGLWPPPETVSPAAQFAPSPTGARVPPSDLRPRRRWYAIAAILPLLGLAGFVLALVLAVRGATDDVEPLPDGRGAVVLEAGEERGLYAGGGRPTPTSCLVLGPGESRTQVLGLGSASFSVDGRDALGRFSAGPAGTYRITCDTDDGLDYAVGPEPDAWALLGSVGLAFALAGLGLVAGLGALLTVFFMRRADRRRREGPAARRGGGLFR